MKAFISHASKDKALVDKIYKYLVDDLRIEKKRIYCTSQNSIPAGDDFISNIKENLSNAGVVLFIITENYMKSIFCIMEMGASWAFKDNIIPIIVPPLDYKVLEVTPLRSIQSVMIDNVEGLLSVFGRKFYECGLIDEIDYELRKKTIQFINELNENEMYADCCDVITKTKSDAFIANKDILAYKGQLIDRAKNNDKKALYLLSVNHFYGNMGFEIDHSKAFEYAKKAAELNYIPAYEVLGSMHYRGAYVKQDFKESLKWYKKAADNQYAPSCGHIAFMYRIGLGTRRNLELAVKYFNEAISLGGDYYNQMGGMYYKIGNVDKAIECYNKSQTASASRYENLGNIYFEGFNNIKPDYEKSAKYYKAAADLGVSHAMHQLGNIYYYGFFGRDFELAVYWYKRAANNGHSQSQYVLAYLYYHGLGTPVNEDESLYWFEKSAKDGHYLSQWYIGRIYLHGTSTINPDYDKAFMWIEKSASQGLHHAQRLLGDLYMNGIGCLKDRIEARKWYTLAANQGDEVAKIMLEEYFNVD